VAEPPRADPARPFDGRVVIVTGGARGIGLACARLLASLGATTVVNDSGVSVDGTTVGEEPVAEAAAAAIAAAGGVAYASTHDLRAPDAGRGLVEWTLDTTGRIDGLVHCAGVTSAAPAHETSPELTARLVDANLGTALNVTYPAFAAMRERGGGRIALLSSGAALFGAVGRSAYAAGKGGVIGFARCLAVEAKRAGVGVNVLLPVARTRMAVRTEIPGPEELAPSVVALVHPRFAGNGGIYSACGSSLHRVAIALTEPVSVSSVDDAVDKLHALGESSELFEPRRAAEVATWSERAGRRGPPR
jgi:NAD(P)-dependent dehydrogenase (short-subunit alcohol dehydrogenase family)